MLRVDPSNPAEVVGIIEWIRAVDKTKMIQDATIMEKSTYLHVENFHNFFFNDN